MDMKILEEQGPKLIKGSLCASKYVCYTGIVKGIYLKQTHNWGWIQCYNNSHHIGPIAYYDFDIMHLSHNFKKKHIGKTLVLKITSLSLSAALSCTKVKATLGGLINQPMLYNRVCQIAAIIKPNFIDLL